MGLSALLVPYNDPDYDIWWIDTKHDPNDWRALAKWGFKREHEPGFKNCNRKLFVVTGTPAEIIDKVQELCLKALARRNVLLVIDEYKHVCPSSVNAGDGLTGVFLRGGGLNVGVIGNTQEPVFVPRQLLSQSTHTFVYDLSFWKDVEYIRQFDRAYHRARCDRRHHRREECNALRGDQYAHALRYCNVDGDAVWRDFPHFKAFHDSVTGSVTGNQTSQKVGV